MPLDSFDELYRDADGHGRQVPVAIAGGADATVIEALRAACDRRWINPLVAGDARDIRRLASQQQIGLDGFTLLDSSEPAHTAVAEVRGGRAQFLMKGQIATPALMHAMLDPVTGLRIGRTICQVVLMEMGAAGRRFLLADTGICVQPTLDQKASILSSVVSVARALGAEKPLVALMAATESVTPAMPETLDAVELVRRGQSGAFPECIVQGPLSFDLAYAPDAAHKKQMSGAVLGAADVMVFPNLLSANLCVKAIMYTADCRFGGVLCGAACPVVFMSRADTTATRLNSLALALRLARR
jgi:phosphotransacetylase